MSLNLFLCLRHSAMGRLHFIYREISIMICPACKKDMIVVEYQRIELDFCPGCRGVWFDCGELELMLESAHLDETSLGDTRHLPEAKTTEKLTEMPHMPPTDGKKHYRSKGSHSD